MRTLITATTEFLNDESRATMVEFALMVALVAAVCVAAVTALGTAINGKFTTIAASI
jgi:pilus assembly protein Flp/PilA